MPKKMPNLPRTVRHVFLGALIVLMGALLAGCWDRTEIEDLTIILSAAFDKAEEGGVQVSLEVFVPKSGGEDQDSSGSAARREEGTRRISPRADRPSAKRCTIFRTMCPAIFSGGMQRFISSVRTWPEKGCSSISISCSASSRRGCMPSFS